MSYIIPNTGQPVTFGVAWTDAANDPISDVTNVSWAFSDPAGTASTDASGNGVVAPVAGANGTGQLVATGQNPDGTTVTSAPFGISITEPDATTGTVSVLSDPNVTPAPAPAPAPEPAPTP